MGVAKRGPHEGECHIFSICQDIFHTPIESKWFVNLILLCLLGFQKLSHFM
jgi:hypothetical protein